MMMKNNLIYILCLTTIPFLSSSADCLENRSPIEMTNCYKQLLKDMRDKKMQQFNQTYQKGVSASNPQTYRASPPPSSSGNSTLSRIQVEANQNKPYGQVAASNIF